MQFVSPITFQPRQPITPRPRFGGNFTTQEATFNGKPYVGVNVQYSTDAVGPSAEVIEFAANNGLATDTHITSYTATPHTPGKDVATVYFPKKP